jgi:ABC-type molybdate transport system substrate-binding protein
VKDSQNAAAAKAWVKVVRSEAGQAILRKFGFLPP